ncbi:hypothetical protein T459_10739 [Capsicum annuum]|uniref:Uncharacterized protein n=1 Tax=Capsicum annuum TaxID=4072 RepID=A0A2G3A343_CAPAN|nr:hypothetical protein T459_10739 [Capsicum annuum]
MSPNPSSLSFTFQAILEQAMRDEKEADVPSKLFELFCFAKEEKILYRLMLRHFLYDALDELKCSRKRVDEALQVFEQMRGSETDNVLVKPFFSFLN